MGGMAETSAQEKLQVEEACADFLARFPGYKKTALLDDLRATEYRRLDERGQFTSITPAVLLRGIAASKTLRSAALRGSRQSALGESNFGGDDGARRTHAPLTSWLISTRALKITFSSSRKTLRRRSSLWANRFLLRRAAGTCSHLTITIP